MDPRIGQLANGKYYAYANGYDQEPVIGTLEEVEAALGLRPDVRKEPLKPSMKLRTFNVLMTFQYPAWDEKEGIPYDGIVAVSPAEAIKQARRQAQNDGHAMSGKGRYWFTATEQEGE